MMHQQQDSGTETDSQPIIGKGRTPGREGEGVAGKKVGGASLSRSLRLSLSLFLPAAISGSKSHQDGGDNYTHLTFFCGCRRDVVWQRRRGGPLEQDRPKGSLHHIGCEGSEGKQTRMFSSSFFLNIAGRKQEVSKQDVFFVYFTGGGSRKKGKGNKLLILQL